MKKKSNSYVIGGIVWSDILQLIAISAWNPARDSCVDSLGDNPWDSIVANVRNPANQLDLNSIEQSFNINLKKL